MNLHVDGARWAVDGATILDGIDLDAPSGLVVGLLGPNGSGKSSLLRLVAGIGPGGAGPAGHGGQAGRVTLGGIDLASLRSRERARRVALVEQETHTDVPLTVREVVQLGRTPHRSRWATETPDDRAAVDRALAAVGLEPLAHRSFPTLSGGERQRVHLARALAQEPDLLLLDEPTNHLDIQAQLTSLDLVASTARQGTTVVVALHDLNLAAAYCDRVVLLAHGRVAAAGTVDEVLVPDILDPVYGIRTTVLQHPGTGRPVLTFQPAAAAPAGAPTGPRLVVAVP